MDLDLNFEGFCADFIHKIFNPNQYFTYDDKV